MAQNVTGEHLWQKFWKLMVPMWSMLLTLLLIPDVVIGQTVQPKVYMNLTGINATVGKLYHDTINNQTQVTYHYVLESTESKFQNKNVRLRVKLDKPTIEGNLSALDVSITQPSDKSVSFRLPPVGLHENNTDEYSAERTICILDQPDTNTSIPLTIVFSTQSEKEITFKIIVTETQDFLLKRNETRSVTVSPSIPHSLGFLFEDLNSVVILVDTEVGSQACMTLSIQTPVCPIFDQEENIHYQGIFQTITTSGALMIQKKEPFTIGFIVVIMAHATDEQCSNRDPLSLPFPNMVTTVRQQVGTKVNITVRNREKNHPTISGKIFYWSIPVLVTIGTTLILLAILFQRHYFIRSTNFPIEARNSVMGFEIKKLTMANFMHVGKCPKTAFCYQVFIVGVFYCIPVIQFALYFYQVAHLTGDSDMCYYNSRCAHPFAIFLDFNHIVSNLPYVIFGFMIFVFTKYHKSELENQMERARESNRVDPERLVGVRPSTSNENPDGSTGQSRLEKNTGDLNRRMSGMNSSSQGQQCGSEVHLVDQAPAPIEESNYNENGNDSTESLLPRNCGVESNHQNSIENTNNNTQGINEYGVPFQYDMFQALGVSLIVEGVLSASYHLCPNEATFQFDTCFMYVIALMTIIHLYQVRHPHCFNEKHAFVTLLFIVVPTVVSIAANFMSYTITTIFMICIIVITCFVCVFVGINYSFLERTGNRVTPLTFFRWPIICSNERVIEASNEGVIEASNEGGNRNNSYSFRFILPVGCLVISVSIEIYWMLSRCPLSTYILYLLVGNMCWNIAYYIFMKYVHGELTWTKGSLFPVTYIGLTLAFGLWAGWFYMHAAAKWEYAPPASRALNQDCLIVFGTEIPFDSHDIWHILSAAAIFCTFNLLLTLDDELIATPREKISVF
ncbi:unnamed protein product [Orchesella dallaii]|uniref:SID1 transmembrane family member 1 n=1 Tax=Orchesella dallaii TaxID=48710 RepID=A0ABP1RQQ6_9HEXA